MSTISELLEMNNEVFICCVHKKLGVIIGEIQPSDYWVGGDKGGFTNDHNIFFETPQQAENHYNREYTEVYAFDNDSDAEKKCDELEALR